MFSVIEPSSYEVGPAEGEKVYSNSLTCIPDSVTFRPPRATRKPVIRGAQTATVTGPRQRAADV